MEDTVYYYIEQGLRSNDEHRIIIIKFDDDGEIYVIFGTTKNVWERITCKALFTANANMVIFGELFYEIETERLENIFGDI